MGFWLEVGHPVFVLARKAGQCGFPISDGDGPFPAGVGRVDHLPDLRRGVEERDDP